MIMTVIPLQCLTVKIGQEWYKNCMIQKDCDTKKWSTKLSILGVEFEP